MKVFVVGDSHAAKFEWWQIKGDRPHQYVLYGLGGISAHQFAAPTAELIPEARAARKMFTDVLNVATNADLILMVLGDGDCRVHFYNVHMRDGIPLEDLIRATVERYGAVLKTATTPIAVLDAPPAQSIGNIYDFDHYGTRPQRAAIAVMWNAELKRWCAENGVLFVGIHGHIADENGFLSEEYAHPDGAHVLDSAVQFVDEIINEYASKREG